VQPRLRLLAPVAALAAALAGAMPAQAVGFVNGSFEQPDITAGGPYVTGNYGFYPENLVDGWSTIDGGSNPNLIIEIWRAGGASSNPPAYQGNQYAELNYNENSTLFQDVSGIAAGSLIGYELAHRGRDGVDEMDLIITDLGADNVPGGGNDTQLFTRRFSNGNTAWGFYSQGNIATSMGNTIRFAYAAVSTSSSCAALNSCGNFLDAVNFGVGVGNVSVPAPLPLLGAGSAFAFSRRLRRRISQAR